MSNDGTGKVYLADKMYWFTYKNALGVEYVLSQYDESMTKRLFGKLYPEAKLVWKPV